MNSTITNDSPPSYTCLVTEPIPPADADGTAGVGTADFLGSTGDNLENQTIYNFGIKHYPRGEAVKILFVNNEWFVDEPLLRMAMLKHFNPPKKQPTHFDPFYRSQN